MVLIRLKVSSNRDIYNHLSTVEIQILVIAIQGFPDWGLHELLSSLGYMVQIRIKVSPNWESIVNVVLTYRQALQKYTVIMAVIYVVDTAG